MVAVAHRDGAHATGIGAGVRLGLGETGYLLAAQRRQQILLFHLAFERIENRPHARPHDAAMPRAGSAIERDNSCSTSEHASTDSPAPPNSSGMCIFQKPSSWARLQKRS